MSGSRWNAGDKGVRGAMETWADYAARGRDALRAGDVVTLGKLIDANFDLRTTIYNVGKAMWR